MLGHFDFRCDTCNDTKEYFIDRDCKEIVCGCGDTRYKVLSAPNFKWNDAHNPNSPSADKWVKVREQKLAQEKKDLGLD